MKDALKRLAYLLDTVNPIVFTLMVLAVVSMNLLANKSINTGLDWLALDCGILFSWLIFLAMDVMTHCYGPKAATAGSLVALALNLMVAALFFVASLIPGTWGESYVEGSEAIINGALNNTVGGTWFVILGSSIAFATSAVVNNFLNYGIGRMLKSNDNFGSFALRSYVSTFIGQFIDNIVFALLVSRTFFGWTTLQCVTCALTGALLELLFEVFFSPVGYHISRHVLALRGQSADAVATEARL
ncbi:MAG: VUT family protein [Atopobiaceae bacterium]|nr:VUT family protein [Atopobiaceae bacterium]